MALFSKSKKQSPVAADDVGGVAALHPCRAPKHVAAERAEAEAYEKVNTLLDAREPVAAQASATESDYRAARLRRFEGKADDREVAEHRERHTVARETLETHDDAVVLAKRKLQEATNAKHSELAGGVEWSATQFEAALRKNVLARKPLLDQLKVLNLEAASLYRAAEAARGDLQPYGLHGRYLLDQRAGELCVPSPIEAAMVQAATDDGDPRDNHTPNGGPYRCWKRAARAVFGDDIFGEVE